MFVLGNFVEAIALIIDKVLFLYYWVLIIAVLLSWVSPDPFNPLVRFFRMATEPVFGWVRERFRFLSVGMLDLSPLAVFIGIWFLRMFLVRTLIDLSIRLR